MLLRLNKDTIGLNVDYTINTDNIMFIDTSQWDRTTYRISIRFLTTNCFSPVVLDAIPTIEKRDEILNYIIANANNRIHNKNK